VNRYLKPIVNYITELSLRERILLLLVSIAVIYATWDGSIYSNQTQYHHQLITQQQQLVSQQQERQLAIANTTAKLARFAQTKEAKKQAIIDAKNNLQQSSKQLNSALSKLVPPTKITELLHNLLLQTHGLKLLELNNEPVKIITLDSENNSATSTNNEPSHSLLYKHATTIKLSGNYQQLYHYLQTIERSKWSLYWDALDYRVISYPNAEITISVHTISSDQYWIGL